MRKILTVALATIVMSGLVASAHAARPRPAKPSQKVEGTIMFPAPFAQSAQGGEPFDGCWGGLTRRTTTLGQGQPNGVFGYVFDVPKASWNKKFKLTPTGGEGTVDLDLFLYLSYPTMEEAVGDPVNGGTPGSLDFQTREEGGEAGTVPPGTTKAIVCLYGGTSHYGYNASFTYVAAG